MKISTKALCTASALAFALPVYAQGTTASQTDAAEQSGFEPSAQAPTSTLPASGDGTAASANPAARPAAVNTGGFDPIIVTARRREETLQDVPIAITVVSQEQLAEQNIISGEDLATYVPSLTANSRFGSDNATFSIRGFSQELRTTSSVGLYFSEVVAQRAGQNSVPGGDGAGPGAFFDLQNVQVLKGPQGTLFGRNTTGGAILLEPVKPTDEFEGYVEGSLGNYDMRRIQAVLNVPITDRLRARFGIDHNKRDGYQKNQSSFSDTDRLASTDYISARASLVWDVNDNIENYTIARYSESDSRPGVAQVFACNPGADGTPGTGDEPGLASFCFDQLDRQGDDFYNVFSDLDERSELTEWQIINKTTFNLTDDLILKNIFSYGEREQELNSTLFGTGFRLPAAVPTDIGGGIIVNLPTGLGGTPFAFTNIGSSAKYPVADQKNIVEELQLQGNSFDDRLNWQVGAYYETSKPNRGAGTASPSALFCPNGGYSDIDDFNCQDVLRQLQLNLSGGLVDPGPQGFVNTGAAEITFENVALYAQGTYAVTDQLNLTAGIRYTWDKTEATSQQTAFTAFPPGAPGEPAVGPYCVRPSDTPPTCTADFEQKSDAPTWLLSVDYSPVDDLLLYAKYARGYRQGSVVYSAPEQFSSYEPEKVDAYEIGAKWTFDGALRGNLNVAAFYNDLANQQIQQGFSDNPLSPVPVVQTTGIVNVGKSRIQGIELDGALLPTENLRLNFAYTYLDTEVKEVGLLALPPTDPYIAQPTVAVGTDLPISPEHSLTIGASYLLPIDESLGDIEIGATYTYTDRQKVNGGTFAYIPSYELVNANISWNGIAGSNIDASLFATNLLDEEYATFYPGLYDLPTVGIEFRNLGQPRMYGARVRYNF